ncbi:IS110 family transposase [Sphingobacterium faecium]|uniref:IS110 family transposase n=1 Tax=Sphingobacterium faecium TaxID=34087 RepID=UPI000F92B7AB|nr:transposase [Sphingobacterium faecium]
MEDTTKFFIGIDVSKPHFDASLLSVVGDRRPIQTERFENNLDGLKLFQKWLRKNKVTMVSNSLLVIENTGIYHRLIWSFCGSIKLPIYIGNSAHIKWSFGLPLTLTF